MEKRLLRFEIGDFLFSLWLTFITIGLPISLFIGHKSFGITILCVEFSFDW